MADDQVWDELLGEEEEGPVLPRRPVSDTAEMDITPMIDITFLLLIFFIVCSTASVQSAVELPPARHGTGVSDRTSVVLTVAERGGPGPALVYLADGKKGKPLSDDEDLRAAEIAQAVEQGMQAGKLTVLVKAERGVKHGDVWRVETAAGRVEGVKLYVAVLEVE
ncbi:MAG TPA: biopolymer transporter ExbD [Thermoguttaceae bacterium]|nr:biopolymer transporter ExbD [Thermoguttaceae bacterium]